MELKSQRGNVREREREREKGIQRETKQINEKNKTKHKQINKHEI